MNGKLLALEVAVAAVLLTGAMSMPAIAADPVIPDNSASNAAPNVVPGDANTPTAPAHDVDDANVTAQIRSALASDKSLSTQGHDVSVATNQQAVVLRDGQAAFGVLFTKPPVSTSQVLHPDRYVAGVLPVPVDEPAAPPGSSPKRIPTASKARESGRSGIDADASSNFPSVRELNTFGTLPRFDAALTSLAGV